MKDKPSFADSVIEDYVKAIYSHTEWQPEPVTTSIIAARLGLVASSVTEMVKKLAAAGLVVHVPYGAVTLTDSGRELAIRMVRRHRLIETWLVDEFGYGWEEVHDEAEVLEHAVSDRFLELISEKLGNPVHDPHGDPIPAADGTVTQPSAILLRDAPDGYVSVVVRISDRNPALLQYLEAAGVLINTEVAVIERKPFGGALSVRAGGGILDLGDEAAAAIWLAR